MDALGAVNSQVNKTNNDVSVFRRWFEVAGLESAEEAERRKTRIGREERLRLFTPKYSVSDNDLNEDLRCRVQQVVLECIGVQEQVKQREVEREERIRAEENPQPQYVYPGPSHALRSSYSNDGKPKPYWP